MVMAHCDDGDERRDGFFRRHKKEEKENDVGVFPLLLLFASFYPSFGFLGKSEGKEKERGGSCVAVAACMFPPLFSFPLLLLFAHPDLSPRLKKKAYYLLSVAASSPLPPFLPPALLPTFLPQPFLLVR